jgi:8-oxo-dGTP pyrophosphatase MutT (NUDIX family)
MRVDMIHNGGYNKIKQNNNTNIIRAGVILTNADSSKILVVVNNERDNHRKGYNRGNGQLINEIKYGLPKGHIEPGESIYQCATRELREETGILARVSPKDPNIKIYNTVYYLLKSTDQPMPIPQDGGEILYSRWVKWDEICTTDCNRGLRAIRDKYKKNGIFKKKIHGLKARSVGIIRKTNNDRKINKDEETYSVGYEGEGKDECFSTSSTRSSYDEGPEDV